MSRIDDIIANVTGEIAGGVQVIMIGDPKLESLKHITIDYFVNDKGLCPNMLSSHVQSIDSIDTLEMYIQQHYSVEDLLSIYKRAFIHG